MDKQENKIDKTYLRAKNISTIHSENIFSKERPISEAYPAIDTDLARDNLENHLSAADLQDL